MKKILSIILSITMLLSMSTATVAFADNLKNNNESKNELYTLEELTNIKAENVVEIAINYNKGERIPITTESSSLIAEIVDSFKDIQLWKDNTDGGGSGGWLYFINFYLKDGSCIQYGTSLHIDKVTYKALDYEESITKMAYYYDLLLNKDGVDGPMQKAKIKVATSADFKPFEYYDENGKLYGFDIELMNYIGERIGFEIEYVDMSFDKLLPAVMGGEVACAISAITVTDERKQLVDFSEIYLDTYEQINETSSQIVNYAIVFPGNSSEKEKLIEASGDKTNVLIYTLVNNAIKELKSDATIEKLLGKYNIPKANYVHGPGWPEEKATIGVVTNESTLSVGQTSTTSVPYSDWAKLDVEKAMALNIINVGRNYNFPAPITREEFCEMIYNLVVLANPDIEYFIPDSFTDTKNEKVLKLSSLGIINGKTATEFAPNDYLTREEAATIIIRMINKLIPMAATEMWFEYDDINEVSEWASDSIQTISNLGFMNGVGNNKFAPKDTYTTEQAIATLVRVYRGAEEAGVIDHNSSIGIIGSADGPTSIIIGGNTIVIEDEGYNNFYENATKNTIKVSDFYVDEAIRLITEAGELAADRDFISLYTTNDEMTNKLLSLGTVDFNKPTEIFYLSADRKQIIANIETMAEAEGVDIEEMGDAWLEHLWKRLNFSTLAGLINGAYGSENLAALTILTNNRGYIMPKDFKNNFALFVQYEGDYSAIVSFYEFGDGVISANMSFVKNGDKDNVFRRMYEITSAVGESGIAIGKVK